MINREKTIVKTKKSYEEIKEEQLPAIKEKNNKNVLDYLNLSENKKALKSIKSMREYLDSPSVELTEEIIMEKLQEYDAKSLINDISSSKEKCYLGLYKLNDIERGKYWNQNCFWDWADNTTKIHPYCLQNSQLDSIISDYVGKMDIKDVDKYFNRIIEITKNNASPNSLKVFSQLIYKLEAEYNECKKMEKPFWKKKAAWDIEQQQKCNSIVNKVHMIFQTLNDIVENYIKKNEELFFLEMNPEEIEKIFKISKRFEEHIDWQEPLLRNLVSYYVFFAEKFINVAYIRSLCDNWKLEKIFKIVYESSNDNVLQEKILDSFSLGNEYLPYLPLDIIENAIKQENNNNNKLMKIISYLNNRYEITDELERKTIQDLNDKIITDSNKSIEIRQQAFNWFYNLGSDTYSDNNKIFWCTKIFNTILNQDNNENVQNSLEFKSILEKCFAKVQDKESIENEIINYIPNGKNKYLINLFNNEVILKSDSLENLQNLILKFIDIDDKNKINLLCEYVTKLYTKISDNDDFVGIKGIDYLCRNYEESTLKKEIENCIKTVLIKSDKSEEIKLKIFKKFIDIIKTKDKELFVEEIYNSKVIELNNIVKTLIEVSNADSNKNIVVKYTNELIKHNIEPELFKQILDYFSCLYNKIQDKETGTTLCNLLEYGSNINQIKLQVLKNIFENITEKSKEQFLTNYIETLYSKNNGIEFNLYLLNEYFYYNVNVNSNNITLKSYIDYIWDNNKYDTNIKSILKGVCKSKNVELIEYIVSKGWKK